MNIYFNEKLNFFDSSKTLSLDFRILQLKKLQNYIKVNEKNIIEAIKKDLNKPYFELYTSEIAPVYNEISLAIKNLKRWMKPKKVKSPIYMQPSKSYIYNEPKGIVLIISPWNYPFQLSIIPLIGAIAAGNCIVLKSSNKSKNTSKQIKNLVNKLFDPAYISHISLSGSDFNNKILQKYEFDHIFFTGSSKVGKFIYNNASKTLTPVTLELGGKSPAIVFENTNIKDTCRKIMWGKFFNAGQTCIAPDYVLVHEKIYDIFLDTSIKYLKSNYSDINNFTKIINRNSMTRLYNLTKEENILYGGNFDFENNTISPTIVEIKNLNSPIMKKEIFGPILPIIKFNHIDQVYNIISKNPYPLSLYIFTNNKSYSNKIIKNIRFGGGCINNCLLHFINSNLPFGGVRYSGINKYHGKNTFLTFSNQKSIVKSPNFDFSFKYPTYNKLKEKLAKLFF